MKIPKTLKIGGHTYKIILEKPGKLNTEDIGNASRQRNEIVLDATFPPDQIAATLFHEILHTLNNQLDHKLLDSLAEQLYQVFSDNQLLR